MAGLSLNNDYPSQKAPIPQTNPNQPPFGSLPPQPVYPNKPMMPPVVQQLPPQLQQQHNPQLNQAINNRPPIPTNNNNPLPFAPTAANGPAPNQVPPPFNGSANQFPPQVRQHLIASMNSTNENIFIF